MVFTTALLSFKELDCGRCRSTVSASTCTAMKGRSYNSNWWLDVPKFGHIQRPVRFSCSTTGDSPGAAVGDEPESVRTNLTPSGGDMYGHPVPATATTPAPPRTRWPRLVLSMLVMLGLAGMLLAQAST